MHWLRRRYVWGLLALLPALPVAALIFSAPLLNDFIRPRLVSLAAGKLAAEVTVGNLSWRQGALQIDDLLLQRPAQYRLEVPRLRLELNLGDLLQGRLTALTIESPFLQWQQGESSAAPSGGFPAEPPLNIRRLSLRQGRISYRQTDTELNFREIDAELRTEDQIRFQLQGVLAGDEDIPLQLAGEADWRKGLQLTLLRLDWADRSLLAEPLLLSIPQGAASTGSGRIRLARFDRSAFEQLWSGLQQPTFWPAGWDFRLQDLELAFQWTEQQGPQLQLQIAALQLQKEGLNLPFTGLEMTLKPESEGWRGRGSLRLAEQNPAEFSGYWAAGRWRGRMSLEAEQPAQLITRLVGGSAPALAGGLALTAEFNGDRQGLGVQVEILGRAGYPDGMEVLLDLSSVRLQAALQSSAAEGLVGQAQLQIEDRPLLSASGNLERVQLQLATSNGAHWRSFIGPALRPPGLRVLNGLGGSALLERQASGFWAVSGRFDSDRVVLDDLHIESLSSQFSLGQGAQGLWKGQVSLAGRQLSRDTLALADLTAGTRLRYEKGRVTFNALQGAAQLAGPGQTSGRLSLAGSGFWQGGDWQLRLAELKLEHLEWMSADGLAGLSGGRAVLRGQLDSAAGQPLRLNLGADLAASEGLWGAYYGDLSPLPLQLEAKLLWNPAAELLQLEALDLRLEPIATLQGRGQFAAAGSQFVGTLDFPQLEGSASEQLVRLLADNRPELADTAMAGGLRADFNLQQGEFWRLQGMLRPRQLNLALPASRLSLKGLNGYLPLDLLFTADPSVVDTPARPGRLQFDEGQLGPVRLAATPLHISVTPNRLTLQDPLVLEIAGGRLTLDDLLLGSVAEGLLLTGQVLIVGVDLELLTAQLGLAPMKGGLDADLGRIHYRGGLLRSEGEALVDAFGGRIRIDRIGLDISNLSYPQFTADVDFQAIDLYKLTQTFAFGDMNGIADGRIHNLRLLGSTPTHFSALFETRLEGRRNISVRALNNLAILSQGGISAALSRGIYRFIDFYRYRRIGIVCELERDLFKLRGIGRSGTDRYLVDGGALPPKIDIIAPPSAIAFSEMLKRLQRIERAD